MVAVAERLAVAEALDGVAADAESCAADPGDLAAVDCDIGVSGGKLVAFPCDDDDPMLGFHLSLAVIRSCIDYIASPDFADLFKLGAGSEVVASIDILDKIGAVGTAAAGTVGGQLRLARTPGGAGFPAGILDEGVHLFGESHGLVRAGSESQAGAGPADGGTDHAGICG